MAFVVTLWTHTVTTLAMVVVIWFVQCVHYPLFARVGPHEMMAYEQEHVRRITWLVAPLMVLELLSAGALLAWPGQPGSLLVPRIVGGVLLAVIWLATFTVQVPLHRRLTAGEPVVPRLVLSNWVRTVAWSGRGVTAVWLAWGNFVASAAS